MEAKRQNRNTLLFVGFFLLAGILHVVENHCHNLPSPDYSAVTILFLVTFMIYTALLIFWIQSVRIRFLPSRERSYMIWIMLLMILYLCLRVFRYRIASSAAALRLSWYAYYVPLMLVPALFLMVCFRISSTGLKSVKWDERLLLFPGGILALLILTNDVHHLVFLPKPGIDSFIGIMGTYTYRLPFYLAYAWMILAISGGMFLLFRTYGNRKNKKTIVAVSVVVLLWVFLISLHTLKHIVEFIPPYESPEIHIFCMLAIFEICIRSGIIPHNENYAGFLAELPMPLMITDRAYCPVYRAKEGIGAGREELSASLAAPVYPEPDRKLCGRQIHGGYAFWIEDESGIRNANRNLQEANELLESENTLVEYENRQKEQSAYLRSRHRIYHEIAEIMYPYQKRIAEQLNEMRPGTKDFRDRIAGISVLNAYVKRKTNLLLMASEKEMIPTQEIFAALSESCRYLSYAGVRASVEEEGFLRPEGSDGQESAMTANLAIALYDAFEMLAEQLTGRASFLMISYSKEGLRLAADTDFVPDVTGIALPVRTEYIDDIQYVTIPAEERRCLV